MNMWIEVSIVCNPHIVAGFGWLCKWQSMNSEPKRPRPRPLVRGEDAPARILMPAGSRIDADGDSVMLIVPLRK